MNPDLWQRLYEYNFWANARLRQCINGLRDEQLDYTPPNEEWSLRAQLGHLVGVENWWFHFLRTGELVYLDFVTPNPNAAPPSRAEILAAWEQTEAEMRTYLATLTRDELQRILPPNEWEEPTPPVWGALFQVLNHSTDHRAQVMKYIKWVGGPTFEQDYVNFLDETTPR